MAVDIPHFALPLRYVNGVPAMVEQDSEEDVLDCVEVILRTTKGERLELPDFGRPDTTFALQPVPVHVIEAAITDSEPRATAVLDQMPDRVDQMVVRITANVSAREVA